MADSVGRVLRDGALDGEQAPIVLLQTTLETAGAGSIFHHYLRSLHGNIAAGRAQAKGVVAVALASPPHSYQRYPAAEDGASWFQVVDCFSDPLGWEQTLARAEEGERKPERRICREMADLEGFSAAVMDAGRAAVAHQPGSQFAVVLDSVTDLLRYQRENVPAVAGFVSALRSHAEISAVLMLVQAACHDSRTVAALAYLSSVNVYVEPHPLLLAAGGRKPKVLEENMSGGRVRVRQRRRNGRYREEVEEFQVRKGEVKFSGVELGSGRSGGGGGASLEVKFSLRLSDKELEDRAKVVLPFEHQGEGKDVRIYDGRADANVLDLKDVSLSLDNIGTASGLESGGAGEIHYLRDSEDEMPDSDEDPDDDLDI